MKNNCCPSTYSITNFIRLGFCWFRNNFFFSFLVAALLLIVAAFFTIVRFFSLYCLVYGYIYCLLLLWGREKDIERAHTFYLLNTYYSFVCCLSAFLVGSVHALIIFRYTMKFAHKKNSNKTSTTTTTSTKWECEKTTTEWFWLDASLLNAIIK